MYGNVSNQTTDSFLVKIIFEYRKCIPGERSFCSLFHWSSWLVQQLSYRRTKLQLIFLFVIRCYPQKPIKINRTLSPHICSSMPNQLLTLITLHYYEKISHSTSEICENSFDFFCCSSMNWLLFSFIENRIISWLHFIIWFHNLCKSDQRNPWICSNEFILKRTLFHSYGLSHVHAAQSTCFGWPFQKERCLISTRITILLISGCRISFLSIVVTIIISGWHNEKWN